MDFIVCGGGLAGCYGPPLLKEGDGVLEAILPCFRLPIGRSSFKSLSTSNTMASSGIRNLGIEPCFCLPFVEGTFLPKGDLRGKHACRLCCTLLSVVVIGGGDSTSGTFCLTIAEGLALDMV